MAASKNSGNGNSATALSPQEQIQQIIDSANETRQSLVSTLEDAAQALATHDESMGNYVSPTDLPAPNLSALDYLNSAANAQTKRRRRRAKSEARESAATGPRGSKPCTLPQAILITMAQQRVGTNFGIDELYEGVQGEPVNYPFSGDNGKTQVSQQLGKLVESGDVERPERGVYVLTAQGKKSGSAAQNELSAD